MNWGAYIWRSLSAGDFSIGKKKQKTKNGNPLRDGWKFLAIQVQRNSNIVLKKIPHREPKTNEKKTLRLILGRTNGLSLSVMPSVIDARKQRNIIFEELRKVTVNLEF